MRKKINEERVRENERERERVHVESTFRKVHGSR